MLTNNILSYPIVSYHMLSYPIMSYPFFFVPQETLAVGLFRQCAAVSVACHWAWAGLGRTKILEGKLAEAASHIQQVW